MGYDNTTLTDQLSEQFDVKSGCFPYTPGLHEPYGYVPSEAAGIVFVSLFGLSGLAHIGQMIWKRSWWTCVFAIGCLVEVLGWGARVWSSQCPYNIQAFTMQTSTLIIAPVFYTAGIYVLLGRLINIFGRESSILSPKYYLIIFGTCDVVSLIVQGAGGGLASKAESSGNNPNPGTHVMVAGIAFQLVSVTIFTVIAVDFLRRVSKLPTWPTLKKVFGPVLVATVISLTVIYIRSIYRLIELAQGWTGYLITHEVYFIALDGAMMVIATVVYNIVHPSKDLPAHMAETMKHEKAQRNSGASSIEGHPNETARV